MSARPTSPRCSPPSLGHELIRLQCYEGLDEGKALYEWEYAKQLLYTQILKDKISEVLVGAQGSGRGGRSDRRARTKSSSPSASCCRVRC